ncbi:MAG: glycosyltransferase family 4 protein, partial [Actinobacteria bacterium]|nr:glycosyltransferase family 4 protein [Actinomycetota bacterium]
MIVNGRFVHSEPGGFRRYALEVSSRLPDVTVAAPPKRLARGAAGKVWEQTALLSEAKGDVLWSPVGSGPIRHKHHMVTIHDVASFRQDGAVGGRFAAAQRWLVPALVDAAQLVVVDSQAVADDLTERFKISSDRMSVVAPGISEVFREVGQMSRTDARVEFGPERLGTDRERPLIGGLVSSIPRKNSAAVLDALGTLVVSGEADAVVAGWDGPSRVFGRQRRPSSPLVADLGALTERDLALFYRCLDVFVWLPSYEGFGLPIVECAAVGTPVVCTPMPAAVEQVGQDVAMARDVEEAVSAVRRLLADRSAAVDMAERAAVAVADLTWDLT